MLEGVAVDSRRPDVERQARRIDDEFVAVPAFLHARPALLGIEIGLDA